MAELPMSWYLLYEDFEGAVERLNATSPRWKSEWYEVCETIFNSCKEWAKKYVLDPIAKAVKKVEQIVTKRKSKYSDKILLAENVNPLDEAKQKCYLFEFFDENDNSICSKVGTTTRTIKQRLTEELKSKTYTSMGAVKAIIHRVYDCGEMPAEGLESYLRAVYIKKYPNSFKKNDRFINEKFDLAETDKIVKKFLEKA